MVELEHVQKRGEERIKPAALPARPQTEVKDDILDQFKRESAAIAGTKPTQAQITEHFDDYARQAILRVAEMPEGPQRGTQWNKLLESFSDTALKVIYKSDPVLALEIGKSRDAVRSFVAEGLKVTEQHGSLEHAGRAEARAEWEQKRKESFIYGMFNSRPEYREIPRDLERLRQATYGQLAQLQRVALTPPAN